MKLLDRPQRCENACTSFNSHRFDTPVRRCLLGGQPNIHTKVARLPIQPARWGTFEMCLPAPRRRIPSSSLEEVHFSVASSFLTHLRNHSTRNAGVLRARVERSTYQNISGWNYFDCNLPCRSCNSGCFRKEFVSRI